jgi:hypothetical protein
LHSLIAALQADIRQSKADGRFAASASTRPSDRPCGPRFGVVKKSPELSTAPIHPSQNSRSMNP